LLHELGLVEVDVVHRDFAVLDLVDIGEVKVDALAGWG
jgi:hypothetical protein